MNLYRKYRPSCFKEVAGQRHVTVPLLRQIEKGMVAHAYLFSGPRGVGKTTVARLLAKGVNCTERVNGEACEKCKACVTIKNGALDIVEIDAASHTNVENIREVIVEGARFRPAELQKKVFIIDEAHMLSKSAFNALLKTLEEPPAHVLFILATTELRKIPETVQSRCQSFDFHSVALEVMVERLRMLSKEERVAVDDDVLFEVARKGQGCMRDAEGVLAQVMSLGEKHITREIAAPVLPVPDTKNAFMFINSVVRRDVLPALSSLHLVQNEGNRLGDFTAHLIELLRGELLERLGCEKSAEVLSFEDAAELKNILKECGNDRMKTMIEKLSVAKRDEESYHIPLLSYELAVLDLCGEKSDGPGAMVLREKMEMTASGGAVDFTLVQKQWPNFIKQIRDKHASLPLALEGSEPLRVEGRDVVIRVAYAFYAEAANAPKNAQFLSGIMSSLLGSKISIKAEYLQMAEPVVDSVLNAFGGVLTD